MGLTTERSNFIRRHPAGAEARVFLCGLCGTTEQAVTKLIKSSRYGTMEMAGAKAQHSFCSTYGPAKAVPLLQCLFLNVFRYRLLKSCPDAFQGQFEVFRS